MTSHQASRRLYRLLLHLYPQNFRYYYGAELEQVFIDSLDIVTAKHGWWSLPYCWIRIALDTIAQSTRQRIGALFPGAHRASESNRRKGMVNMNTIQDIKLAVRSLVKRQLFTAIVVLTIGVGIAGNTAIFSVANAVLVRSLPFHDPERLVTLDVMGHAGYHISLSIPNYLDWKERNRSFESIAASSPWTLTLTGSGPAEVLSGRLVIGDFFRTLGVDPALGRLFAGEETEPGAEAVAVLGHRFWNRRKRWPQRADGPGYHLQPG